MHDFILHHYDFSPFSEKIRTLLGHKNAHYKVVNIPIIMPKPYLVSLTGGIVKPLCFSITITSIAIRA
jgi:hypothetical protein